MNAKYAFIAGEEGNYPVIKMCTWARVSRSGYYEWRDRAPSATEQWRQLLHARVQFAFEHSDGTSGYRRIHAQLARWGHFYDDETVRRVDRVIRMAEGHHVAANIVYTPDPSTGRGQLGQRAGLAEPQLRRRH